MKHSFSPKFGRPYQPGEVVRAEVITRWAEGCQIRIADTYDTIVDPAMIPTDIDVIHVRVIGDECVIPV